MTTEDLHLKYELLVLARKAVQRPDEGPPTGAWFGSAEDNLAAFRVVATPENVERALRAEEPLVTRLRGVAVELLEAARRNRSRMDHEYSEWLEELVDDMGALADEMQSGDGPWAPTAETIVERK